MVIEAKPMIEIKLMDDGWLFCRPEEVRMVASTEKGRPDLWERGIKSEVTLVNGEADGRLYSPQTVKQIVNLLKKTPCPS